jgi:hypothetical protein
MNRAIHRLGQPVHELGVPFMSYLFFVGSYNYFRHSIALTSYVLSIAEVVVYSFVKKVDVCIT